MLFYYVDYCVDKITTSDTEFKRKECNTYIEKNIREILCVTNSRV